MGEGDREEGFGSRAARRVASFAEAGVTVLLLLLAAWLLRVGEATELGWVLAAGLPLALLAASPALLVGVAARRPRLVVGAWVLVVAQVALVWPLLPWAEGGLQGADGGRVLQISALNVFVDNGDLDAMASDALAVDRDVLGFVELTPEAETALAAAGIERRYPYRVGTAAPGTVGAVLYSRHPLALVGEPTSQVLVADVAVPGAERTRVLLLHVFPPGSADPGRWRRTLDDLDRTLEDTPGRWVAIGDVNATMAHRPYRDLLRDGRRDAHLATGRARAGTWPAGGRLPAMFLIDRAIVSAELRAVRTAERTIAGTDHRMLDVDVAPLR